jgi:hypothetical protein
MKRNLQRRKDEPLYKWLDRVTEDILFHCSDMDNYRPVLRDILGEICKESYIEGVHTEQKIEKKYHK